MLLNITGAPAWAEGPGAPPGAQPGTWRPDPAQFASFATAAALRYDGRFPDPLHPGAFLPRVRYWQPWNEPNLAYYLSPQWTRVAARLGSREPDDLPPAAERVLCGGEARLTLELRRHGRHRALRGPARWPADAPGRVRSRPVLPARRRAPEPVSCPGPAAPGRALAPPVRDRRPALARLEPGRRRRARHVQDRARLARSRARGPRAARRAQAAVGHGDLLGQLAAGPERGPHRSSRRTGSSSRCTYSGARAWIPCSGCRSSTRRRSRTTAARIRPACTTSTAQPSRRPRRSASRSSPGA